jgi:hypothetical protein
MNTDNNYFDIKQENVVHDVFLMIESEETEHDCIEDVLIAETTFTEDDLSWAKE